MATMKELQSDKALVCRREVNGEQGGAVVWHVMLSDGHLVDCGSGGLAEARANTLAEMINEAGPERLSRKSLSGTRADRCWVNHNDYVGKCPACKTKLPTTPPRSPS